MNILLINSKKEFGHSKGLLNETLHNIAKDYLIELGHEVTETIVDNGYVLSEEVNKILSSNVVIYQMPAWWMGPPWILKKYFDDVFTEGYEKLYLNDGRSRSDPSKKYGSGGLLQGRKYMLSVTWNANAEAFDEPDNFFEGVGVDGVYLPVHKANQFLGMMPLETFMCNDVIKVPQIDLYISEYKKHLDEQIGKAV